MFTNNIDFKNFSIKSKSVKIRNLLKKLLNENNEILDSLKMNYKDSFTKKKNTSTKKIF